MAAYGTRATDSCTIFAWAAVHDCVDGDLDGVLVGNDMDLGRRVSVCMSLVSEISSDGARGTYDFEGVSDDADSHKLLAVVAAVHHQRVGEALDDGALRLAESLHGIPAGGV